MANEKENVEAASQTGNQPNSRFSEQPEAQSSAQAPESFEEFRERFGSEFDDYLDRKLQSVKDKRLGTHETRLEQLEQEQTSIRQTLAEFNELKEEGWTDAQAIRLMEQKQQKSQPRPASKSQTSDQGTESAQTWMEQEQAILEKVGINDGDPRFIEFIRENKDVEPQEYINKLQSQSLSWRNADLTKPKPSPSTVAQTTKGESPASRKFDDKSSDELGALQIDLMKDYRKNESRIKEINAELERRDRAEN